MSGSKSDASPQGSLIYIDVIACENEPFCKSEEEIREYFADKYMFILKNQIHFDQ